MSVVIRNKIWMIGLLICLYPVGYISMLASKPLTPRNQYIIMSISVGIGVYLVMGIISWVVYFIAKKKKNKDPIKLALIVFTVLISLGVEGRIGEFNEGTKKRNRYEFMEIQKSGMYEGFLDEMKKHPEAPAEIVNHAKEICDCIFEKIEFRDDIIDELMTSKNPKKWFLNSPLMMKMVKECIESYRPN